MLDDPILHGSNLRAELGFMIQLSTRSQCVRSTPASSRYSDVSDLDTELARLVERFLKP